MRNEEDEHAINTCGTKGWVPWWRKMDINPIEREQWSLRDVIAYALWYQTLVGGKHSPEAIRNWRHMPQEERDFWLLRAAGMQSDLAYMFDLP